MILNSFQIYSIFPKNQIGPTVSVTGNGCPQATAYETKSVRIEFPNGYTHGVSTS